MIIKFNATFENTFIRFRCNHRSSVFCFSLAVIKSFEFSEVLFFYSFLLSRGKQRRFLDKVVYELLTEFLDSRREADLFLLISLASLASFCLWAKILAYSAAAWRFFSARLRLTAKRWRFLCNMIGVTRRWTWNTITNGINIKILQWSGERIWIKNEWN